MTNEAILKELLRGESSLSADVIRAVSEQGATIGPQLIELIRNIRLWHTEDVGQWAVLHAIRLLSSIPSTKAIPALVDAIFLASSTRFEDALEDLPIAFAKIGEPAIVPLESVFQDQSLEATIRSVAASSLEGIAVLNPDAQETVLEILRKVVLDTRDLSGVRGHVIPMIAHFRNPEDRALIKRAALAMPMMLDMDTDEIDAYFNEADEPDTWAAYRGSLLDYYR
jgi:hypothetical protein